MSPTIAEAYASVAIKNDDVYTCTSIANTIREVRNNIVASAASITDTNKVDIAAELIKDFAEDSDAEKEPSTISSKSDLSSYIRGKLENPFLFKASKYELEKFLLSIIFVSDKNAESQLKKLDAFIDILKRDLGEFVVEKLGPVSAMYQECVTVEDFKARTTEWLKEVKSGQYGRISSSLYSLGSGLSSRKLDLRSCTRGQLAKVKGLDYKSASMFLFYTIPDWRGVVLDKHILKYLREEKGLLDIPEDTPVLKEDYTRIEAVFLQICKEEGKKPKVLDIEIWNKYSHVIDTATGVPSVSQSSDVGVQEEKDRTQTEEISETGII